MLPGQYIFPLLHMIGYKDKQGRLEAYLWILLKGITFSTNHGGVILNNELLLTLDFRALLLSMGIFKKAATARVKKIATQKGSVPGLR